MDTIDAKMQAEQADARDRVTDVALDIITEYEDYVESHDDARADNLKNQTRDNLRACVFNEVMKRLSRETTMLASPIDPICMYAADIFTYKTWYGVVDLAVAAGEFEGAMMEHVLEFPVEPFQEVYRINDRGDYVDNAVFEAYWEKFPERRMIGWMLADNGQLTFDEVAEMSYEDAKAFFDSDEFEPEVAFFTTADENGCC